MNKFKFPKKRNVKSIGGFHGISAIFPKFKDIIDYEEHNIYINRGYPRFVTHPIINVLESENKKNFDAVGAISCHSYQSAIFLVIDFFFRKGNKIYFDSGVPLEHYNYLSKKFPGVINKVKAAEADILMLSSQNGTFPNYIAGKVNIGLLGIDDLNDSSKPKKLDLLIRHDQKNNIGIVLIFSIRYAILTILRRHVGFNVSSRKICCKEILTESKLRFELNLKSTIANLEHGDPSKCFLFPSGMAAIFVSIFSLLSKKKNQFIALGSLYVDTIRILEKWPTKYGFPETIFIRESIIENLENNISDNTAGIIVEFPSNPLIQLVDLEKVVEIAHSKGVKVIVDNTIATPYNFNPFEFNIDIIIHSTTKFLSGKNNHIGGVLLLKDYNTSKKIEEFIKLACLNMPFNEIRILTRNIRTFKERMKKINENSAIVAKFLENHKAVKKVYHPSLKSDPNHSLMEKYLKGGSGLLSFILRESTKQKAEKFYDNLHSPILKGPSLGSEKTLLSPYVIMAHYEDSKEELEKLGFDFYLMRLSVGIEDVDRIIKSLDHALNLSN